MSGYPVEALAHLDATLWIFASHARSGYTGRPPAPDKPCFGLKSTPASVVICGERNAFIALRQPARLSLLPRDLERPSDYGLEPGAYVLHLTHFSAMRPLRYEARPKLILSPCRLITTKCTSTITTPIV
jgi:hypothetical protein